jgi:prepilin-type N-terminal cleavage/methylation domain-containing protein
MFKSWGGNVMNKGFTLIELMIVVTIIAFLAALGIPHLFKYKSKAYQAEVAMNLASLHTAQQAYFAQHGKYAQALSGPDGIGWKPAGYAEGAGEHNFYYTYGFNSGDAQEGVHFFTGKLKTPKELLGQTSATATNFTAAAAGTLDGKGDVWQVNETREIKHVVDALS